METAQQQHNRISLSRIDSGLEYLRRKQQQLLQQRERRDNYGPMLMSSSFIQLPNSNFSSTIKPIAYVQPRTNLCSSPPPPPYVNPNRYPTNVRTNPRVSPSHEYSRNNGKGGHISSYFLDSSSMLFLDYIFIVVRCSNK